MADGWVPMERMEVYIRASALGDRIYHRVSQWPPLGCRTVGEQLVRSADSIAANLIEGDSAGSPKDSVRFFRYARSSGREARHWLRCAAARGLLRDADFQDLLGEMTEVVKMVNGLLRHRKQLVVRESSPQYREDPFTIRT